jgi:hypothetical protein
VVTKVHDCRSGDRFRQLSGITCDQRRSDEQRDHTPFPATDNSLLRDQAGAIAGIGEPRFQVHFPKMRLPGRTALARAQIPVERVTSRRRTNSQDPSSLIPVGWSLIRPGLRNEALIVYNCR